MHVTSSARPRATRPRRSLPSVLVRSGLALLVLSTLCVLPSAPLSAQSNAMILPPGFIQETVTDRLDGPTSFAFGPDGRIYVTQKAGAVKVIQNGELLSENFIDLSHEVNQMGDRGLMGVAVHPQFPAVPYLYFAYVYEPLDAKGFSDNGARVGRVLRIEADPANPNVHRPDTGVVLVGKNSTFAQIGNPEKPDTPPFSCVGEWGDFVQDCIPTEGTAHTVNTLRFGTDGSLYVSVGDGSVNGNVNIRAQDIESLAGKILRINPNTGQGYASNPFYDGDPNSNRSKVYALGLRNPFRFSLHPSTGELYVGEVGNDAWEEISRGGAGANFGWPCFEGPAVAASHDACQPLFDGDVPVVNALYAYPHERSMGAAIGGDFYTGTNYPDHYRGAYFFADFNAGLIEYMSVNGDGAVVNNFARNVLGPVQISMGPDGNLYVLSIVMGALYRIRYVSGENTPPTAVAIADPAAGAPPLTVEFSSEESFDPDGDALTFEWDFGDGGDREAEEANPSHTYEEPGQYTATLTATDSRGEVRTATVEIAVGGEPPDVTITAPERETLYRIGDTVSFSGTATDAEDGELSGAALQWDAVLHHNEHVHYDFFHGEGSEGSFDYVDHGDNTYLELCLTATDADGLQGQDCVDLRVQEVTYTFDSEPSGLPVLYAGSPYVTPFSVTTQVGGTRRIGAVRTPSEGVTFAEWSDGGAGTHEIVIGSTNATLLASYTVSESVSAENIAAIAEEQGAGEFVEPEPAEATDDDAEPETEVEDTGDSVTEPATNTVESAVAVDVAPASEAPNAAPADGGSTGTILREWWSDIGGREVADLTGHPDFPNNPTGREMLPSFETPIAIDDDYGTRIRGYIHPPVTGDYVFWIASDDTGELLLSTDADPANAVGIARAPQWTRAREWDKYPEQTSHTVYLEAGQRYYIEALQKEADVKDNLSVAWQIPGEERTVIDGAYLSPFIVTDDGTQ